MMQKLEKMTETLAHGYSSERSQPEISNEYQHGRVYMVFKNLCALVLWTKVASALEGLRVNPWRQNINETLEGFCEVMFLLLCSRINPWSQNSNKISEGFCQVMFSLLCSRMNHWTQNINDNFQRDFLKSYFWWIAVLLINSFSSLSLSSATREAGFTSRLLTHLCSEFSIDYSNLDRRCLSK